MISQKTRGCICTVLPNDVRLTAIRGNYMENTIEINAEAKTEEALLLFIAAVYAEYPDTALTEISETDGVYAFSVRFSYGGG